ncbi:hypothetical protein CALVIDRAFT_323117 [Calocera viscosa TUFC12733]|uniref:Uncharacterized protein n=1 Tax=Calocera viscosa (strain TUFC12733) TaxID=1330018 RepID=A0A167QQ97_CALVF|nr:hypothetical protein CALVIDRAFT_323117 [Calocera viscosa TUFC12733]
MNGREAMRASARLWATAEDAGRRAARGRVVIGLSRWWSGVLVPGGGSFHVLSSRERHSGLCMPRPTLCPESGRGRGGNTRQSKAALVVHRHPRRAQGLLIPHQNSTMSHSGISTASLQEATDIIAPPSSPTIPSFATTRSDSQHRHRHTAASTLKPANNSSPPMLSPSKYNSLAHAFPIPANSQKAHKRLLPSGHSAPPCRQPPVPVPP